MILILSIKGDSTMRNFCPACGGRIIMQTRDSKQAIKLPDFSQAVGYGVCPKCLQKWKVIVSIEKPRKQKHCGCSV
jgi:DNA-directed RNA polymerase subunit RPC12/RpoP